MLDPWSTFDPGRALRETARFPPSATIRSVKAAILLILLALSANAEDKWIRIKSGPFEVLSNAGERPARERMYEAEQFRWALGQLTGKPNLTTVWSIRILTLKDKRNAPLSFSRDSWISAGAIDENWRKECARILLTDNTRRLPPDVEQGLMELVSTLQVNGTRLSIGAPPAGKTRAWARMRLLATAPEYYGRMRVFISNLEQTADLDIAYKNAFQKRAADIEKEAAAATNFEVVPMSGRALSEKDFTVREATAHDAAIALADLTRDPAAYTAAGGPEGAEGLKHFDEATAADSKSARAWLALGTREGFLKAAELNPRWAEPQIRLASLEQDPGRKATYLQKATVLDPRDTATWRALAHALLDARQYAMASKAWSGAEQSAPTLEERAQIHQARLDIESKRADFEESERRRIRDEEARDLQRVKNLALAEVRAAEGKVNDKLKSEHGDKPEQVVRIEDLDQGKKLSGKLESVECMANGQARLLVRAEGKPWRFVVQDPGAIHVAGGGEKSLGCGPQKPPRTIVVEYRSLTEVQSIELP